MGIFIDKRLDERYHSICQAMQFHQSIILRKLANNRNEEIAFGRFLNNKYVTPRQMIKASCKRTAEVSRGRDVLLIQDTSTMGFGMHSKINGLGRIGDGKAYGFFLHPVISVEAQSGHCLGLASASHYDRKDREDEVEQRKRDRLREPLAQKESFRWYEEIQRALSYGRLANNYTVVADREAYIYELLVLLTALEVDFVIRSSSNRRVHDPTGDKLADVLATSSVKGAYEVALPATDKRSSHTAQLEVKWVKSHIAKPRSGTGTKHLAAEQAVTAIEVRENPASVVGKEKPIHWRLLTSHEINTLKMPYALLATTSIVGLLSNSFVP
ncbi:MAG: IS4 family transposase [Lewinella sp.]|uniref:IS4 family transposase n=1 Tax=Lewinella sp. TaxID=2004506 RepID=UPI003D6B7E20